MGYREDVALAYSAKGWDELTAFIGSVHLTDEARKEAIEMLDSADKHSVNEDGGHLLTWESIKTTCDPAELLFVKCNQAINSDLWLSMFLGPDGNEEMRGNWFDNPFNICACHTLHSDNDDCEIWAGCGLTMPPTVACKSDCDSCEECPSKKKDDKPVNDYICGCGNDKLNKTEKSCWKCGAPIT